MELRITDAERIYQEIANAQSVEAKLKAYALCNWGAMSARYDVLGKPEELRRISGMLEQSLQMGIMDFHMSDALFKLARIARYEGKWESQRMWLTRAREFFEKIGDNYGLMATYSEMKRANARRGIWKDFLRMHENAVITLEKIPKPSLSTKLLVLGDWNWCFALMGRLTESERNINEALRFAREIEDQLIVIHQLRDMIWILGVYGNLTHARACFDEAYSIAKKLGEAVSIEIPSLEGFIGIVLCINGDLSQGQEYLRHSLDMKIQMKDHPGVQEPLLWLGLTNELSHQWEDAEKYYRRNEEWKWYGRIYFDSIALTGLIRVK
ncbi:MAG: hypothetical protein ACPL4I_13080, partial [Bacteroidota bacterium]